MIRIPIQPSWVKSAETFATDSISTRSRKIASRGQSSEQKVIKDIAAGTVAEYGVQQYFRLVGLPVSNPDTNVYQVKDKRWGADLVGSGLQVHVKTFTNPKWFSWVFTYNPERGDVDPVILAPSDNDVLALTQVTKEHVLIHFLVTAGSVINLYRPPLLPQLRFSKLVLYPDDVRQVTDLTQAF